MSSIDALAAELQKLPGVGTKTAYRLAYHLVKGRKADARRLAQAVQEVVDRVRPCPSCGNYCDGDLCGVCADPSRDRKSICVVEEAWEVGAVDRSGRYRGLFHVLGGRLSPLDGVGPENLNVDALLSRLDNGTPDRAEEIILATNASVEGEATAVYLEGLLRRYPVRVTRLARGIPMGSDLEYVDGTTIAQALDGRREMHGPTQSAPTP